MLFLRSAAFALGMVVSSILYLPLIPVLFLFSDVQRYRVISQWSRLNLWWLAVSCNLRYRVVGTENIPAGPAIILAKHQSAWETLAMQQIFPPQTWVLKRELLWLPFFGWGLAMTRPVAIDRKAGKKALKQVLEQGADRLRRGLWLVIFPEGTRTSPGEKVRYAVGGAMLAERSGVPVVPVAHNAGEFWPKQGFIKQPGVITLAIGPVIETNGIGAAKINAAAEEWIETTMETIQRSDRLGAE